MPEPLLTIDADATEVLAALDRVGPAAQLRVDAAAKATAAAIVTGAQGRVRRATGTMAAAITSEPAEHGGHIVFVDEMTDPAGRWGAGKRPHNLPLWHEHGTRYITEQPFIGPAAALEEGAHLRRVIDAINGAIEETGLGD